MYQAADPDLLAWLADEERILLTHDIKTMPGYVYERIQAGLTTPGVIAVRRGCPLGQAIQELEIVIDAGQSQDFENQVRYIPLT